MNSLCAKMIETMGIRVFASMNKKKSDEHIFQQCSSLKANEIKAIYSKIKVFKKCENFNKPIVLSTKVLKDVEIRTCSMESRYKPIEAYEPLYKTFAENQTIYFEHITSKKKSKKEKIALIYLHGFSERDYKNEINFLFPRLMSTSNPIEILAVHLPFHMLRSPKNQPYSGAYLFDSCPIVTIEGMRQAVDDVSQILSYGQTIYSKVMVGGFSLGGHVTSFLGTCDNRADLYIMGQAGAKLPQSLKELPVCPGLNAKKDTWISGGQDFESLYDPIELLNYKPLIPKNKVVSIAGLHDRLITYERVSDLRDFYMSEYPIDYKSGHMGLLFEWKTVMESLFPIMDKVVTYNEKI
ncbi:alpha/beta hydrolase family protein [Vallitalea pronyensis]|uniref:Alpha/beta hydrolase family protein n=1 Tax=Vallitalea pronyensis TaxID=1348613 RepID=A0A8J8SFY2_9FIRM|nr:alpha/beta hydrolase family protein [Vallitalea pronyensis]QUI21809.1 alpha/beta hydrolase family protein [Vallitalea pronyensis]